MVRKVGVAVIAIAVVVALAVTLANRDSDDSGKKADKKSAAQQPREQVTASMTLIKVMEIDPQFTTFQQLSRQAGLARTYSDKGPYTLLVPSTGAFASLDSAVLKQLTDDPSGELATTLKRHIITGRLRQADLIKLDGKTITALNGDVLPVATKDGAITVGGVPLAKTDIDAKNGEIHILDSVIPPPG